MIAGKRCGKTGWRPKGADPKPDIRSVAEPTQLTCEQELCALVRAFPATVDATEYFETVLWPKIQECFPDGFTYQYIPPATAFECSVPGESPTVFVSFPNSNICMSVVIQCYANGSFGAVLGTWLVFPNEGQSCFFCPDDDCMCCDCGCGCGESGENMATCDDLIAKLEQMRIANIAVSINIDALRQTQICLLEFFRLAFPNREFWPTAIAALETSILTSGDVVAQQVNHLTTQSTGIDAPPSTVQPVNIVDETDLFEFELCTVTAYCPPGQHMDPATGTCVDDEPGGGGGGGGGGS